MFAADGLLVKRPNGEQLLPFYFAYEDLLDDWEKLPDWIRSQEPKVAVKDFTAVMCLSEGIGRDLVAALADGQEAPPSKKGAAGTAIIPPRREIGQTC